MRKDAEVARVIIGVIGTESTIIREHIVIAVFRGNLAPIKHSAIVRDAKGIIELRRIVPYYVKILRARS